MAPTHLPLASALSDIKSTLWRMFHDFLSLLPKILIGLVVFVALYFLAQGVQKLIEHFGRKPGRRHNAAVVIGRLAKAGIILTALLIALSIMIPSFTAGQLVNLLGIGSVAIGFAFRDIFQNFLAGILLLLTEPFRVGDQIVVNNYEGTVEDIQTRATFIRTYDNRRIVIPNSDLFTQSVTVNTAYKTRRLEYDVGIGYGDDIDRARALILEAIHDEATKHEGGVIEDPAPDCIVVDLAESSVNLRARWWIDPPQRGNALDQRDKILTAIKNKLNENGIDLPFPTRQVLFHDQTEETDGDRAHQREGWPAGKGEAPKPRGIAAALRQLAEARARLANAHPQPGDPDGDRNPG